MYNSDLAKLHRRQTDGTVNLKVWLPIIIAFIMIVGVAINFGGKVEASRLTTEQFEKIRLDYVSQKEFNARVDEFRLSVNQRLDQLGVQNSRIEDKIDALRNNIRR